MINFGRIIKKYREKTNTTQNQLAIKIGVTPTYVSALENNRKEPSIALLREICKSLQIPPELLFWDLVNIDDFKKKEREIVEVAKQIVAAYYKSE